MLWSRQAKGKSRVERRGTGGLWYSLIARRRARERPASWCVRVAGQVVAHLTGRAPEGTLPTEPIPTEGGTFMVPSLAEPRHPPSGENSGKLALGASPTPPPSSGSGSRRCRRW